MKTEDKFKIIREELKNCLGDLAKERFIFHSEADFQFALSQIIQKKHPKWKIRLEKKENIKQDLKNYVDIIIFAEKSKIAIELKYKTKNPSKQPIFGEEEKFELTNQAAQDLGRYFFLKDVRDLEQIKKQKKCDFAYAIFLTNDSSYWKEGRKDTMDKEFRISEGKTISGQRDWNNGSEWTKKHELLKIKGEYIMKWEEFSSKKKGFEFRYLLLEIK